MAKMKVKKGSKESVTPDQLGLGEVTDVKINAVRPEVLDWSTDWVTNRAFRSGSKEVKALKELVLPPLDAKQPEEEYTIYLDQAILFTATAETADIWEGLIFKKEPVYKVDNREPTEQEKKALLAVTDTGMSATELLREVIDEVIQTNRYGVLVDYPLQDISGEEKSRKQQLEDGDFSNCLSYEPEAIINWHYSLIKGDKMLSAVILKEKVQVFNTGSFETEDTFQYRVLTLEKNEKAGTRNGYVYRQQVYTEQKKENSEKSQFRLDLDVYPTIDTGQGAKNLDMIPFWIFNRAGQESADKLKAAIIAGIVELNKGHFRNSADYENEIHRSSIKTPVIPGGAALDKDIRMGGVIETQYPDAKPYILESKSPSPLASEMKAKEERMASIGARALGQNNAQVTTETARIQAAGEESTLGDLANIISEDFADMLQFKLNWDFGNIGIVTVQLNTDYFENEISIPELIKAWAWVEAGGGSFDAYFNLLDKRNVYPKDWTMEQELARIKATQLIVDGVETDEDGEVIETTPKILDENGNSLSGAIPPGVTLNGAQISAAIKVAESVASGDINPEQGVALLVAMGVSPDEARTMIPASDKNTQNVKKVVEEIEEL